MSLLNNFSESLECQTTQDLDKLDDDNIVIAGLKIVEENCRKDWKLFYRNLIGEFSSIFFTIEIY